MFDKLTFGRLLCIIILLFAKKLRKNRRLLMRFEIKGDKFPVVICELENGESMANQQGAMAWMSPNMKMETNMGKSIGKLFSRAMT